MDVVIAVDANKRIQRHLTSIDLVQNSKKARSTKSRKKEENFIFFRKKLKINRLILKLHDYRLERRKINKKKLIQFFSSSNK